MATERTERVTNPTYQIFMIALCTLALLELAVDAFVPLSGEAARVLYGFDIFVCGIFFADFLWSLWSAPNRARYMLTWGWVDLLSSIPTIDLLRWGRAARVLRAVKLLRGLRAVRSISAFLLERRQQGALLALILLSILLLLFSSIAVLQVENRGESPIRDAADAVTWAASTMASGGAESVYPISPEGRALGVLLALASVLLLGVLSGYVASWFLQPAQKREGDDILAIRAELAEIRTRLQALVDQKEK